MIKNIVVFSLLSPSYSTGMFGTGILSYFSFLRFLVMLNLTIFIVMFSFVMLPIIVSPYASGNSTYNQENGRWTLIQLAASSTHKKVLIPHLTTSRYRQHLQWVSKQRSPRPRHVSRVPYRSVVWWSKFLLFVFIRLWKKTTVPCCFLAY